MPIDPITLLIAFAGVFIIAFMKGPSAAALPSSASSLLSLVMDPLTAGGLLAPLFISGMTCSRCCSGNVDLVELTSPSCCRRWLLGIALGFVGLRQLDHRAVAIIMALITLLPSAPCGCAAAARVGCGPRSTPKAVAAGLASGVTTMVAHSGGPPLAMYLLPLGMTKELYAGNQSFSLPSETR